MLHYLFTNDLRHDAWPGILVDSANLIFTDQVPSAAQDKSKNNYIKTQESYLCLYRGTKANDACRSGSVEAVILNFIDRFQFPNARTESSFLESKNDNMSVAPLRLAVQILFALNMSGKGQAHMSYDELAKYIICDEDVATGKKQSVLKIVTQIIKDREDAVVALQNPSTEQLASMGIQWKHCPRQIRELFSLLEFAPFIKREGDGVVLRLPSDMDSVAAKQFFYIINNQELWEPPNTTDWNAVQESYCKYMNDGILKFDLSMQKKVWSNMKNEYIQLITYGAPGTGKSHKIDKSTNENNSIRVTFHPDTDYAAFVGAYKPTMESSDKGLLTLQELKTVLQSLKDRGETRPEQKLGAEFWQSFEKLTPAEVKSILDNDSMYAEVMKGVAVGEYLSRIENGGKQIVYSFVPQAFLKAYVEAWKRYTDASRQGDAKNYYLVIEEINRGNCAQIFGDLFQLLDRADNGFSAYAITPDDDIQKFLETDKDYKLTDISLSEDIKKMTETGEKVIATAADIKSGKKLILPPNLCILATMNTSDQSLFPMDSAFKRRWDWEYMPIKDEKKGWKIKFDDCEVDWWEFLGAINKVVKSVTNSADKQLGYFFVKAKDTVIDEKMFVNKVAFYLWNDVFKDCELDGDAFKIERDEGEVDVLSFQDFFKEDGTINEEVLKSFLTKLVPQPETVPGESEAGLVAGGEA